MKWVCRSGTAELGTRLRVVRWRAAAGGRGGSKLPMVSSARPRGDSDGERCAAGVVPNFRCSPSRGVPMASGARAPDEEGSQEPDLRCRAACGPAGASDGDRRAAGREGIGGGGRSQKLFFFSFFLFFNVLSERENGGVRTSLDKPCR
uniref:Uncharacterized protein n=1 Tax=Ananas comosus var. bracteatus TaxID=296719 RepID=A0A6V7PRW5_ANACO|nr:unnamed protein product [Ananas comosus var. bracteatus]